MRILAATVALTIAAACGGEGDTPLPPPDACASPNRPVGERCLEPGVADDGCPAGTLGQADGSCRPAGMLAEDCAEGFVHLPFEAQTEGADGVAGSCEPIIPADACPPGLMAVPGDTACRPVADCGSGTWGNIPHDQNTVFVDQSFTGVSDGSINAPFTTIGGAATAAPAGGLVAIAAGSYLEDIVIVGKPVRLWGVCPQQAEIVGTGAELGAVFIRSGADGTEVRGLALRGAADGLVLSGSQQVVLSALWIHDNAVRGLNLQPTLGPTSMTLEASLIEQNAEMGLFVAGSSATIVSTVLRTSGGIQLVESAVTSIVDSLVELNRSGVIVFGSEATIEATVVRMTQPNAQGSGSGIEVQRDPVSGARSSLVLRGSVVEQNPQNGVIVFGSDVAIDATAVRGTLADAQGLYGFGIIGRPNPETGAPSVIRVARSLADQNRLAGVAVSGSELTLESNVVRGTQLDALGTAVGVVSVSDQSSGLASTMTLRGAAIENNYGAGVSAGGVLSMEGTIVRATLPSPDGHGVGLVVLSEPGGPSTATVFGSRVELNSGGGVGVSGSSLSMEATVVRDTQPDVRGNGGSGIYGLVEADTSTPSVLTLKSSAILSNHYVGVGVYRSSAHMSGCLIADTLPSPSEGFGDGVGIVEVPETLTIIVEHTEIVNSARAGVSAFGSSVSLGATQVRCADFDLDREPSLGVAARFEDLGDNGCGCPASDQRCVPVSAGLDILDAPVPVQ